MRRDDRIRRISQASEQLESPNSHEAKTSGLAHLDYSHVTEFMIGPYESLGDSGIAH